jgi:hypothetical protein
VKITAKEIIEVVALLGLLFALHLLFPKVITKTETKVETKVVVKEVIKYVTSNSTITGATSATLTSQGTAVSGTNLTITNTTTITQTATTTLTEHKTDTVKEKYALTEIIAGAEVVGAFKDYGGWINFKTNGYELGASYIVLRKEYQFRAGTTVISW